MENALQNTGNSLRLSEAPLTLSGGGQHSQRARGKLTDACCSSALQLWRNPPCDEGARKVGDRYFACEISHTGAAGWTTPGLHVGH